MEVVLAVGSAQAVFFAILLFNKQGNTLADRILGIWLLVLSVHLLINYLEHRGFYQTFPHLVGSSSSLVFLYGPFLFLYIDTSIKAAKRLAPHYLYHFIPFLVYNLALIPFYLQSGSEKLAYSENLWAGGGRTIEGILLVLKSLYGPVYIVLCLLLLRKHRKNISNLFSDHENIDLRWLRYLVWSMAIVLLIFLAITITKVNYPGIPNAQLFIFLAMAVWILALGYYGIKQSPIFIGSLLADPPVKPRKTTTKQAAVSRISESQHKHKLLGLMENDKPFLRSKLTLHDLARDLDLPPHQLSTLINREFGQNFYELVNQYRVEEVKRKLADPGFQHLSFLGIAQESGFNSKASFNRIFKKMTGLTPNQYRKKQLNS